MSDGLARVDRGLQGLEDVFPADHDHRVDAAREQRSDPVALQAVALVLQPVYLHQMRGQVGARAQAAERPGDLLTRAHEHVRELHRLLHRRFNAVETELGGSLLGVINDVVERRRERVAVAGAERRPHAPASREPVDDVVGDTVALPLAHLQILGEGGVLGIVDQQVVQQQPAPLHVAPRLLDEGHERTVQTAQGKVHPARILAQARAAEAFTISSPPDYQFATWRHLRAGRLTAVASVPGSAHTLYAGELQIGLNDGLVLAGGRALTLSVREFELLVALARRIGSIVTRAELYTTVWGGELRPGDRSVDVYVSKLRGKLEAAMPDRRFIHTHTGFGYRFQPQPSRGAGGGVGSAADAGAEDERYSRNVHVGSPGS